MNISLLPKNQNKFFRTIENKIKKTEKSIETEKIKKYANY